MEDTVNLRVKHLIKSEGLSVSEFSRMIGVSQRTMSNMLSRGTEPSVKTLQGIIERFPKLNSQWLLTGEEPMLNEDSDSTPDTDTHETRPRIPDYVTAGSLAGFLDSVRESDCERIPVVKALPPYDFTIIIKGDSMEPKYEGGDEIAIREVNSFIEWGKTYVLVTRDGMVIKRLYDAGDSLRCVSFNPDYPDFNVAKSEVVKIFKVVGLIRIQQ